MFQFPFGHSPASHLRLAFHRNKHQGRDAPHVEGLYQLLLHIAIHLVNINFPLVLPLQLFQDRGYGLTRDTPIRVEIYHNRTLPLKSVHPLILIVKHFPLKLSFVKCSIIVILLQINKYMNHTHYSHNKLQVLSQPCSPIAFFIVSLENHYKTR